MEELKTPTGLGMTRKGSEETKAEYSPWGKIFMRIEIICDKITEFSIRARFKDIMAIESFFNLMLELYDHLYPLLIDSAIDRFEAEFERIKSDIDRWTKEMDEKGNLSYPIDIMKELEDLKREMFDIKQKVGLGVPVEKVVSIRRRLTRIMGVSHE